jgi:hypothetical protein
MSGPVEITVALKASYENICSFEPWLSDADWVPVAKPKFSGVVDVTHRTFIPVNRLLITFYLSLNRFQGWMIWGKLHAPTGALAGCFKIATNWLHCSYFNN